MFHSSKKVCLTVMSDDKLEEKLYMTCGLCYKNNLSHIRTIMSDTCGLYYKCLTIVMTLACIIKLEMIIIDDPHSLS
jgi:hypothetical protein